MTKDNFQNFCDTLFAYDYEAKAEELALEGEYKVYLYLSTETDSFIEYGDFHCNSFANEFHELLVGDGYLEPDGGIADKVERILCWQVWVNFLKNGHPYAGVHLYNFTDEGIEEINDYVKFSAVEE